MKGLKGYAGAFLGAIAIASGPTLHKGQIPDPEQWGAFVLLGCFAAAMLWFRSPNGGTP